MAPGYQVMMDCLHILDPEHPDLVLNQLPEEVLEEMLEYSNRSALSAIV